MSSEHKLSVADVKKLVEDPSAENRADTAGKISNKFATGGLSNEERAIAEDIFRVMVRDVEVRVRKALAESLKDSPSLPVDVAKTLANDVNEVALPVIETSVVLSDEDLIHIIQNRDAEAQAAVARRERVSENVSDALVETENEDVIATLVSNDGAEIRDETRSTVVDKYGALEKINAPLAQRSNLPLHVAERLVNLVSEKLRDHLVTHQDLSADMAMDLIIASRERATIGLISADSSTPDVRGLVRQLEKNKRLTPTIILRALFMGDMTFFEEAIALRADVPAGNVFKLLQDRGPGAISALLKKADMPVESAGLVRTALDITEEMQETGGDDREKYRQLMIERVLTQFEDDFDGDHLDYFLGKLAAKS